MSGHMSTKLQHRYMPPARVGVLRCESCDHWFGEQRRCGLIRREDGDVNAGDCCRYWESAKILNAEYGVALKPIRPVTRPPDLGRLLTKVEAAFAVDVDESIDGCADCVFFNAPGTCTLMRDDYVEAAGACALFWSNPAKEADDDRLYAPWQEPPPEADASWVSRMRRWLARFLKD